jgi:hypothetical protein
LTKRRSDIPFEKKILNLGVGDFEAMGMLFPALGPTVAIRTLVHNYVRKVRSATAPVDIEIPEENIEDLIQ